MQQRKDLASSRKKIIQSHSRGKKEGEEISFCLVHRLIFDEGVHMYICTFEMEAFIGFLAIIT